jgi:hypothetical protein
MTGTIEDAPKSPIGELRERWLNLKRFRTTQQAVADREPLFDYSPAQFQSSGYLKPWEFQKLEAALSSLPAIVALLVIDIFNLEQEVAPVAKWSDRIFTALAVLFVPWLSYLAATWLGRASLLPNDRTPERVARARRAFIYLSNTYLFWPELLMAVAVAVNEVVSHVTPGPIPLLPEIVPMWYLVVMLKMIPNELLEINGYRAQSESWLDLRESSEVTVTPEQISSLRRRWRLVAFFGTPILAFLPLFALYVISIVLAVVIVSLGT